MKLFHCRCEGAKGFRGLVFLCCSQWYEQHESELSFSLWDTDVNWGAKPAQRTRLPQGWDYCGQEWVDWMDLQTVFSPFCWDILKSHNSKNVTCLWIKKGILSRAVSPVLPMNKVCDCFAKIKNWIWASPSTSIFLTTQVSCLVLPFIPAFPLLEV